MTQYPFIDVSSYTDHLFLHFFSYIRTYDRNLISESRKLRTVTDEVPGPASARDPRGREDAGAPVQDTAVRKCSHIPFLPFIHTSFYPFYVSYFFLTFFIGLFTLDILFSSLIYPVRLSISSCCLFFFFFSYIPNSFSFNRYILSVLTSSSFNIHVQTLNSYIFSSLSASLSLTIDSYLLSNPFVISYPLPTAYFHISIFAFYVRNSLPVELFLSTFRSILFVFQYPHSAAYSFFLLLTSLIFLPFLVYLFIYSYSYISFFTSYISNFSSFLGLFIHLILSLHFFFLPLTSLISLHFLVYFHPLFVLPRSSFNISGLSLILTLFSFTFYVPSSSSFNRFIRTHSPFYPARRT